MVLNIPDTIWLTKIRPSLQRKSKLSVYGDKEDHVYWLEKLCVEYTTLKRVLEKDTIKEEIINIIEEI